MITYDKAVEYVKRYYFKEDKNIGKRRLYDSNNNEFVPDDMDTTEIRAGLSIIRTIGQVEGQYVGVNKGMIPYKTKEEELTWKREQAIKLQEELIKRIDSGKYELTLYGFSEMFKTHTADEQFFIQLSKQNEDEQRYVEDGKNLIIHLCESRGKKLTSFDIGRQLKGEGMQQTISASFETKEMSFKEKLNPKSSQYTQSKKIKELTPEQKANRRQFSEEFIKYYLMTETDDMYQKRVDSEDGNMKFVANKVNRSQEIIMEGNDASKLARLLLAAKNISLDGQTDFFEKVIAQPSISKALAELKTSGKIEKAKVKAEQNKQAGLLINGKPKGHVETKGEVENRISNRLIQQHPNAVDIVKSKMNGKDKVKLKEQRTAIIYSMVARTQGKLPSYTQNSDGTFDFNSDEARSK